MIDLYLGIPMKGVSGIVATAMLLTLTIAGGVLLYNYVMKYLNSAIDTGKLIIENAYYIGQLERLIVEVRNVGSREVTIDYVEILMSDKNIKYHNQTVVIPPGETGRISIDLSALGGSRTVPQYIIVVYNNGSATTEPVPVKIR